MRESLNPRRASRATSATCTRCSRAVSHLKDRLENDPAVDGNIGREACALDRRTNITRESSLLEHRKQRLWNHYLNSNVAITAPPMRDLKAQIEAEAGRKEVLAKVYGPS